MRNYNVKNTFFLERIDQTIPPNPNIPAGFNFRYANYYYLQDPNSTLVEHRDLYKVYGLRFLYLVSGIGYRFAFVPLFINIGSGIALLSVATVISDVITLYLLPGRRFYNQVKYEEVPATEEEDKRKKESALEEQTNEKTALLDSIEFDK